MVQSCSDVGPSRSRSAHGSFLEASLVASVGRAEHPIDLRTLSARQAAPQSSFGAPRAIVELPTRDASGRFFRSDGRRAQMGGHQPPVRILPRAGAYMGAATFREENRRGGPSSRRSRERRPLAGRGKTRQGPPGSGESSNKMGITLLKEARLMASAR